MCHNAESRADMALVRTFLQEQHHSTDGRQRAAEARSTAIIEESQAADPQLRCIPCLLSALRRPVLSIAEHDNAHLSCMMC